MGNNDDALALRGAALVRSVKASSGAYQFFVVRPGTADPFPSGVPREDAPGWRRANPGDHRTAAGVTLTGRDAIDEPFSLKRATWSVTTSR